MSQVTNNPIISSPLSSLWNYTNEDNAQAKNEITSVKDLPKNMQQVKKAYAQNDSNQMASAAESVFASLGLHDHNKISFAKINEFKDEKKAEFSKEVEAGLEEVGIDKNTEYQLVTNYSGEGVDIITDSHEKAKIQQFYVDNPHLIEEFKELQFLDNLEKTRESENISENLSLTKAQLKNMSTSFYEKPSSSIMSYGQGSTYFGMGFSAMV